MVSELKKSIEADKAVFGIRECIKNLKTLDRIAVSSDARPETIDALEKNGAAVEILDMGKKELADKLELDFLCEVFGVKK